MPCRPLAATLLLAALVIPGAHAAGVRDAVAAHVPDAVLVGEGRLKVMFWELLEARLYAPGGRYRPDAPFALSLSCLRSLDGHKVVAASIEEMARQGGRVPARLARWRAALGGILVDLDAGTEITGVRDARGRTLFYRDGEPAGRIDDPAFTRAFFDIWLGESTSRPRLRDRLVRGTAS